MRYLQKSMIVLALAWSSVAFADPVVKAGGKPGIAKAWTESGGSVVLELESKWNAQDVAKAIAAGVSGSSAKVDGGKVVVTGVAKAQLLKALEKVEIAGGGSEDVDSMLAALQSPGGDEEGSGSSIRATKAADFSDVMGEQTELVTGKVVSVERGAFPIAVVTVRVFKAPKGKPEFLPGRKITVLPLMKITDQVPDLHDKATMLNVGAYFVQPGDRVQVRLNGAKHEDAWVATAFERKVTAASAAAAPKTP